MRTAMKFFFSVIMICSLSIFCLDIAAAQEKKVERSVGLSATLQQNQFDVLIPIWISKKVTFAPAISALYVQDAGMDLGFGFATRFYTRMDRVAPYVGLRAGVLINSPEEGDSKTDFVFGGAFGGEYFFHEKFSIGIEAQANVSVSDSRSRRFGNPSGTNVNTATTIIASVYF